jgi:hypothetical protein
MVKTNIQTFSGEVEILSNLHVGNYLTANGTASNVLDITGNVGATFFVGDGGFLSNIATTLNDIVANPGGNTVSNTLVFESGADVTSNTAIVTYANVGISISNTEPTGEFQLSIGSNIFVNTHAANVLTVVGAIGSDLFIGDGGLLSNIATTIDQIIDQGNTVSNTLQLISGMDATSNTGLVTHKDVGISISNTAPTGEFQFGVGSNLFVNTYSSNVLSIEGNVNAQKMTLGTISVTSAYGLNHVTAQGSATGDTISLSNVTTGLEVTSNITAGGNVTAETVITSANVEVGNRLKFASNVFVDDLRIADLAANLVTYDKTTGELMDSGGLFANKLAVVSVQPPSVLTANATTIAKHGTYTVTTSSLAENSNAWNAFDGDSAVEWTSSPTVGHLYSAGESTYAGTSNLFTGNYIQPGVSSAGEWLAVEFPYKTTLRHMKLTPPATLQRYPASANVYATNDSLTWTEVAQWGDVDPVTSSNVQTVVVNATESFKKYAMVVTKANGGADNVALAKWDLFAESFSIDGGQISMAQQPTTGGETMMEQSGPHGRGAAKLKKYPEIVFESGKFDSNESTNTYVQAGYTVTASGVTIHDNILMAPWKLLDGISDNLSHRWRGETVYVNNSSTATPSALDPSSPQTQLDTNTSIGEYLIIKTPSKIQLKNIIVNSPNMHMPYEVDIYGRNEGVSTWTHVKNYTYTIPTGTDNSAWNTTNQIIYATEYYSEYAFVIVKTNGRTAPSIGELELYGYEEDIPLGDTSVDTTFTSIMNTPQTTGAQVYVDGSLGETFTNRVVGPTVSNTHTTYVSAEKYWELSGNVESNVTLEANTFLSGDAPHSVSMWFNSSNLEANASNSCIFSLGTEERLDHVGVAFSNTYQTVQKLLSSDLEANDRFGYAVAMNSDGTKFIVGAFVKDDDVGNIADAGAAYIYTYNGSSWDEQKLMSPDIEASARFGWSVSMNSDGTKVIVGASFNDEGATSTGAAYIFTYSGGSWDAGTKIVALDKEQEDYFGYSVAMSGDGNKVIVGAYLEDDDLNDQNSRSNAGSAYIYTYDGSNWDTGTKIIASDRAVDDIFGRSVAINSNGTKVIVGAEGGEAAYIFTYNGSSWVQQQILVASDGAAGDKFGWSVGMNSNGTKVIVGAYLEDPGNLSDAGAAYIYTYDGSNWDTGTKIVAPDKEAGDVFGISVAMNSDGTKVIVGAYLEHAGGITDAGAAYIFAYDGSNWDTGLKITAPDKEASDQFSSGTGVAMSGDGARVVVGANLDDVFSANSGAVYVYDRDTTHHLMTDLKLQSNTWHNLTYAYQGEGGSRVTYLDGRKVAEDQAEDTFGDYPPFAMTGYSQGGYVVSSNEENGNSARQSWCAFDESSSRWQVDSGYSTSSPFLAVAINGVLPSITDTSGTAHVGHWIKLELPFKIKVNRFKTTNYINSQYQLKSYVILGSNDDVNWTLVHTELDADMPNSLASGTEDGIFSDVGYFKYLKMLVKSKLNGVSATLMVQEISYYGHRENDLVRLPDPTNVLKYPHIAMTGPAQRGYVANVSSTLSSSYNAFSPFNGDSGVGNLVWISESGGNHTYTNGSGNGQYTGTVRTVSVPVSGTGTENLDGEYVELELPHKIKLTDVGFQREYYQPNDIYGPSRMPAEGSISASNDGVTWYTIHSWTGLVPGDVSHTDDGYVKTLNGGTNFGTINTSSANYGFYKYYRFIWQRLYRVGLSGADNPGLAGCNELQYYGTEEATPVPIQIGGGNIDKVANFRVYDKFVGEDQALEIWDAQKDEFRRAKSSMTLQKGRLGIGTTEPEGRLAVADEPDPTYGLQEFPPKPLVGYKTHIEGHGEFCASASSIQSSSRVGWVAFDKSHMSPSTSVGWISGYDPIAYNSSGVATGNIGVLNGVNGEYLILQSPYKIKMDHVLIYPRAHVSTTESYSLPPKDGKIWGRNVIDEPWTEITSYTNLTYGATRADNLYGQIPTRVNINATQYYKYIAFQITATNVSYQHTYTDYTNIKELRYFGYREQVTKQSVLHDGQLTLTKNLTVPRIGPALDADDTPRRDRLVVEYNTSTNPTFDGAVRDTSGRGSASTGALIGGATYDATGKAFEFPNNPATNTSPVSGKDSIITQGIPGSRLNTQMTVSTWLRLDSPAQWEQIWGLGNSTTALQHSILYVGNGVLEYQSEGGGGAVIYPYTYTGWNHVTIVRNSATFNDVTFYVNGSVIGSSASGGTGTMIQPDNIKLTIGGAISQNHYWLDGAISQFKLYDTALTAEEVKTLYDMGRCDEGHHVVNFSKTRVGIGLGDGEAPTYTLDVRGQIRSDGSLVTSFTGQHKCIPDEPMEKGLIVSAKKNQFVKLNGLAIGKSAITIDESLPIVSLSNVAQDKACFGVVSSIEEANTTFRVETTNGGVISTIPKTLGDNRAIVNSVGEGAIWVVDTNGSLESGDYITTSNVVGYGQKQDDDILHNYTVAKITMDCDFTGSNVAVQTIKREETGLRTIMEDTWNQLVDYDRSSNNETQYSNTLAPSAYTDQPGYTPREVTTIVDYTNGSNIVSIAEWSNLESNIQNTYQSNTFTEIVDYTKFVSVSEWSNLTTDVQNTYSEAEITTYYQIQRGENVLDENGQLQFEDKTGATEAPYERRFLDASGAQTDSANAVHIAAFVGCTYHCG